MSFDERDEDDDAPIIADARELYAGEEIQIDDGATVSLSDGGAWVQAWVWVPAPDPEAP